MILIVCRQEDEDHWQLPQGGLDGLSLEEAAIKEIKEELNAANIKIEAAYTHLYRYDFPNNSKEKKYRHTGYKGQKQGLVIARYLGEEKDLRVNYWDHKDWRWVEEKDFLNSLHECRKKSGKIYLEKFQKLK